jgi:ABC-type transporter Mla MlaB component
MAAERTPQQASQVSFMAATGLAVLINVKRAATQQGITLQLGGVSNAAVRPPTPCVARRDG